MPERKVSEKREAKGHLIVSEEGLLRRAGERFNVLYNLILSEDHLLLKDWKPKSVLTLDDHTPEKASCPVIDVHTHLGELIERSISTETWYNKLGIPIEYSWPAPWPRPSRKFYSVQEVVKIMDACNVEKITDMDGISPISESSKAYRNYSDRFIQFNVLSFRDIDDPKYGKKRAADLEKAVSEGARGLKVFKELGLYIKDKVGRFVPVDDPRFDPVWDKAGELGVPVLIHTADPISSFWPVDRFNPSYVNLRYRSPFWSFYGWAPEKKILIEQRNRVLEKHKKTVFIGAHCGSHSEDLGYLSTLLDKYNNLYVDMSARIGLLGMQPYSARELFMKYQDRILFGTDGTPPNEDMFRLYFRFLETKDEYFQSSPGMLRYIYGIHLPSDVLDKIYRKNAEKLIPKN